MKSATTSNDVISKRISAMQLDPSLSSIDGIKLKGEDLITLSKLSTPGQREKFQGMVQEEAQKDREHRAAIKQEALEAAKEDAYNSANRVDQARRKAPAYSPSVSPAQRYLWDERAKRDVASLERVKSSTATYNLGSFKHEMEALEDHGLDTAMIEDKETFLAHY